MTIFRSVFGKRKSDGREGCCDKRIGEGSVSACACSGGSGSASSVKGDGALVVKVMGSGCKKCHQLYDNALEAASRFDGKVEVEYVTDIEEIASAGVVSTPALQIGGTIVSAGRVLPSSEIEKMLQ